ncbi:sulfite exporter TauE/SafE family protein [Embleya scabrispora]|uniref:sulfite exporter TauE/SafE family protein n=1 Tax=Embleya scabrispora TaxID=159449 RepID=UPI0003722F56|nr:sulfite exporter TauE/SafE family protein [Embleya scabrispora]MYS80868.1 TSUP family transporter [Streptomyces sp. SID5474]
MNPAEALLVLVAGLGAGTVNTVVGSGSLLTFPVLLALGYPPVVANVSNTIGLTPGSISGALGYRLELAAQSARLLPLSIAAVLGGASGGLLLLGLPPGAFRAVVPVLVLLAALLMAAQPWLSRRLRVRRERRAVPGRGTGVGPTLLAAVFTVSVYGGYFGAAQGVLLLALLATVLDEDLNLLNGLKNLLQALVNLVAAVLFALTADVAWTPVLLLALGSVAGGRLGALLGRRVPAPVLRTLVVLIGTTVGMALLLT